MKSNSENILCDLFLQKECEKNNENQKDYLLFVFKYLFTSLVTLFSVSCDAKAVIQNIWISISFHEDSWKYPRSIDWAPPNFPSLQDLTDSFTVSNTFYKHLE